MKYCYVPKSTKILKKKATSKCNFRNSIFVFQIWRFCSKKMLTNPTIIFRELLYVTKPSVMKLINGRVIKLYCCALNHFPYFYIQFTEFSDTIIVVDHIFGLNQVQYHIHRPNATFVIQHFTAS
jgi:hypothetical protein